MSIQDRMADFQPTFLNETTPVTHTYYVGDLCYVLNSDQWFTVCAHDFAPDSDGDYDPQSFLDPEAYTYEDEEAAKPFYIFRTAYGDGCYEGSDGNSYCVDSGTIGCIRTDYADPEKLADAVARGLGHLHEFDPDFNACYCGEEDGTIWFDTATYGLSILTASDWEDYEDEEDDDTEEDA